MDQKELKDFITSLRHTDIEEMQIESDDLKVFFRKNRDMINAQSVPVVPLPVTGAAAEAPKKKEFAPIKSTMVGTFYHSGSPDRPPFVIEGNHVVPGQKVGIIEAMKIMK